MDNIIHLFAQTMFSYKCFKHILKILFQSSLFILAINFSKLFVAFPFNIHAQTKDKLWQCYFNFVFDILSKYRSS